jgi:Flp pilus assembly pilin Flp
MKRQNKGQSALEYTLLLGVIIVVLVAVLINNNNNLKSKIENAYNKAGTAMDNTAQKITDEVFEP